jgi:hypothetical protein
VLISVPTPSMSCLFAVMAMNQRRNGPDDSDCFGPDGSDCF